MVTTPLVIYHKDCFDGFTAAWIFRNHFGSACDFHPAAYGSAPPECAGRVVYVVDFSYPPGHMLDLAMQSEAMVVLDHHKTAEAALAGLPAELQRLRPGMADKIVFDMNRSGAGIAWDYLFQAAFPGKVFSKIERPWLVDYVEDRDLWRQALPRTREVSAYIASLPMTFEEWDTLSATPWKTVADKGAAVQRYIDTYGAKAREMARLEAIGCHVVPTVNLPYMNCSEHVGALAEEHPDAPFAAGYFRRADGRWQFSLRSRGDFDVSEVAKAFGGGGHAGAAGFDVASLPWEVFNR